MAPTAWSSRGGPADDDQDDRHRRLGVPRRARLDLWRGDVVSGGKRRDRGAEKRGETRPGSNTQAGADHDPDDFGRAAARLRRRQGRVHRQRPDLHDFPVDPQPFVLDETFRRIYTDGKVEFDQMSKYNLNEITAAIKTNVNARLGSELIQDVLIDELNYVDKETLKQAGETKTN